MSDAETLAGEHQHWCQAEAHADCCAGDCDCGRDERRDAIASALAAEREKARAPFLALADEVESEHRREVDAFAWGVRKVADRIRETAQGGA